MSTGPASWGLSREEALAFCRDDCYRLELAWTRCDYADVLLERGAEGGRANAATLVDESLASPSDGGVGLSEPDLRASSALVASRDQDGKGRMMPKGFEVNEERFWKKD